MLVDAGIEDHGVGRLEAAAQSRGVVEQPDHVGFLGGVGDHEFGAAAGFADGIDHLLQLARRAAGGDHVIAFGRETPADGGADAAFGPHANDHSGWFCHSSTP